MQQLFVGVAVTDFSAAVEWYGRLFGRPADVVAHDHEVMWRVAAGAWLYILGEPAHAGGGLLTVQVQNLDEAVAELLLRGISSSPIEAIGDAGRKTTVTDPEGNLIALVQIAT